MAKARKDIITLILSEDETDTLLSIVVAICAAAKPGGLNLHPVAYRRVCDIRDALYNSDVLPHHDDVYTYEELLRQLNARDGEQQ
jgi:hypothetical protein